MVNMENAEEVMQILDRFTRLKQKEIPKELDDYLQYVAKTGDTVFKWSSLKYLFREKLLNVIKNFHDTTPRVDEIPQYPNVDPFNYENMKSSLLERLELFNAAPFTIQRLCELLIDPRKQYSRIDKFMRALEKNILVVSTIEPGRKRTESENGDSLDSVVNGDLSLDVNVDIDMENEPLFNMETQNGNGNGNGNGTSAVTAGNAAETPPTVITSDVDGVETSPKSKSTSAAVLEVPNVPHRADDDVLPNPKKAKLDLNAENDENEEKQEVDGVVVSKRVDGEEVKDDVEVAVDAVKASNNGEDGGEVAMQEDVAVDEKEKEEKKQIEKAEEKEKVDDLKESAVEKVNNDKQVEEKENEKDDNVEKQQKESEELPQKVNNEIIPEIKVHVAANNVDSPAVEEEKIIEKEELEQSEKEQKKLPEVTVKKSGKIQKEQQQNGNECETKESTATTTTYEVKLTNEVEAKKVVAESENKPLEKDQKTGDVEKEEEAVVKEKEKEVEVSSSTTDKTDDVTENLVTESTVNEVNSTCVEKKTEKEDATAEATATKADEKKKTEGTGTATAATTTTPATPEESTTTTTTEAAAASTVVTSTPPTPIEADPPLIVASIDSVTVEQISNNEVTAVVAAIAETSAIVVDAVTNDIITSTPTTTTPTPTPTAVGTETTAITESASATTTTTTNEITNNTPAVTLEPMEDVLLEEVPPTVEEVVMAETSSGGATAMATDSMEPPIKDDDGGMEVDDTSQEAMDQ